MGRRTTSLAGQHSQIIQLAKSCETTVHKYRIAGIHVMRNKCPGISRDEFNEDCRWIRTLVDDVGKSCQDILRITEGCEVVSCCFSSHSSWHEATVYQAKYHANMFGLHDDWHLVEFVETLNAVVSVSIDWSKLVAPLKHEYRRIVESPGVECHVTLNQMAAIVSKSKRTLERLRQNGKLPNPSVKGGQGKADEWQWQRVKEVLEHEYGRQLPDRFPAERFIRY